MWPALLATAVAAGAATLVLRPRSGLIEPAAIELTAYFSPAELERSADFRDLQRVLGLAGVAVSGVTLAVLARRPPPIRSGAVAAAGVSVVLVVVGLPLAIWRHERAVDAGLSTQSIGPWLVDVAKSAGIGAFFAALGGALVIWLIRRFPGRWWIPDGGCRDGVRRAHALPVARGDRPALQQVRAAAAGASCARTCSAWLTGPAWTWGRSTAWTPAAAHLGERLRGRDRAHEAGGSLRQPDRGPPPDQVRSVVAHELGHVVHDDVPKGLLWIAIVAPAGTFLIQRLAERFAGDRLGEGVRPDGRAIPAVALAFALVSFGLSCAGNALSRPVEARADAFALETTRDSEAFIELEKNLTLRNLGDPDPRAGRRQLFGTHPTTKERLGFGVEFGR